MRFRFLKFLTALFLPFASLAQGTLEVSNLGLTPNGSAAVASDSWLAQRIITGNDSGGCTLNSIQLLMDAASGSPAGFSTSIYSFNTVNYEPGTDLGSLTGTANPSSAGVYSYAASGITLLPSTIYYVVLTDSAPLTQGNYVWSYSGVATGNNQWGVEDVTLNSANGTAWLFGSRGVTFQLGVYATPLPEPSTFAIGAIGVLAVGWQRWRKAAK